VHVATVSFPMVEVLKTTTFRYETFVLQNVKMKNTQSRHQGQTIAVRQRNGDVQVSFVTPSWCNYLKTTWHMYTVSPALKVTRK